MKIGIDIDDTISDTYEVTFAYAQKYTIEELGKSAKIQNITNVYHHDYVEQLHNWNEDEKDKFWYLYYGKIIQQIKPLTLAVETINNLKKDGHKIIIITARWPEPNCDVPGLTLEWLQKNNIPYDDIIMNADNKAKVAIDKKIDIFIDDSFKNCKDVANVGIKTYMMNTRMNQSLEDENITRVYSWTDIKNRIKKEENI